MYFEKTDNKRMKNGIELVQIRYTQDNPYFNVKAGQLGGWVSEKATLGQNGKWFIAENVEVFGGYFEGGNFNGGNFNGGYFKGGNFNGGNFYGGNFYGGNFEGGYFKGGNFKGGNFNGGYFYGGYFKGGNFWDGNFRDGNFYVGFGEVPFLCGGKYPVNFAGYSETGERMFACGCQVFPESKWTSEFRSELAKEHGFTEQERVLAEKLFEVVKKMTPKKTIQTPEKPSENAQTLDKISENVASMKIQATEPLKTETISLAESLKVETKETFEQSFDKLSQAEKVNLLKTLITKM